MIFAENQEENKSYTFQYVLLKREKLYLIIANNKEIEAHETRSHFTITKNSKVVNK